jgi:hypothetical protein
MIALVRSDFHQANLISGHQRSSWTIGSVRSFDSTGFGVLTRDIFVSLIEPISHKYHELSSALQLLGIGRHEHRGSEH